MSAFEHQEALASWLVENGYAEARPGYGHIDGEQLAERLLGSDLAATTDDVYPDELAGWLVDNGCAEERPGFGHIDGERLAEALLARQDLWRATEDED
ncbi:hypothetical protein [Paenarthrobacter sp. C1]|uniref:hypothetical protein n=1 Tax=Paenarthrobacter sp. C1 TaxID=3400220 RepID=UPI003BF49DC0